MQRATSPGGDLDECPPLAAPPCADRRRRRPAAGAPLAVKGIAFDGGQGIREVAFSTDGGRSWRAATLGADLGRYSFREFHFGFTPTAGQHDLRVRAWNRSGQSQPMEALWQPAGYMRNVVEAVRISAA